MLGWALTFLVIALIAAALGFGGIAGASAGIAQILFYIFLVLLLDLPRHALRQRGSALASSTLETKKAGASFGAPAFAFNCPPVDQARSKRSAFITLVQAATKSCTNFSFESAQA